MILANELLDLYNRDEDVALVFDSFAAIDHVYKESLRAMGYIDKTRHVTASSANITLANYGTSTAGQLTNMNKL